MGPLAVLWAPVLWDMGTLVLVSDSAHVASVGNSSNHYF